MDNLRKDIEAATKAAARRRVTQEEIEKILAEYASDIAEIEFRRKKLDQEQTLLRWFVIAALISAPLLLILKIATVALKIDVDLPEWWIMGVWAVSLISGINSGYKLVKLDEYIPNVHKRALDKLEVIFTPEHEDKENEDGRV